MNSLPLRRAGIAVVTIECEESTPERLLIRVRTVEDVSADAPSLKRPFATVDNALTYMREWLEKWSGER
jgi:hypothetical protein